MIIIRVASTDDAGLIADMSRQTFYETFTSHNTKENMEKFMIQSFSKEALMKEVGEAGNIFLLAYEGDQPVGYARMRQSHTPSELKKANAIEIARIYATAHAIGKGVGKAMMQYCIKIALERSYNTIWLGVWEHNHMAIEFYTKWGFEKFGTHVFMLGNDAQTDWLMMKTLNPG
jgi:diamine N-acetyltransferase